LALSLKEVRLSHLISTKGKCLGEGSVPFEDIFSAESPPFARRQAGTKGDVHEDKAKLDYFSQHFGTKFSSCTG
jgi:hypothetical protein